MYFAPIPVAIEDAIPLPPPRARGLGAWLNPILGQMQIGQSIFIPGDMNVLRRKIRPHITTYGKRYGKRYATRRENNGMRFWRLS